MAFNTVSGSHGRDITAAEAGSTAPAPSGPLDEMSFHDVLQAINPLQYLPLVGTIYRLCTGDDPNPGLRTAVSLVAGALTGGPVGVLTSIAGAYLEHVFHFEQVGRALITGSASTSPSGAAAAGAAVSPSRTPSPTSIASQPALAGSQIAVTALAAYNRADMLNSRVAWGGRER